MLQCFSCEDWFHNHHLLPPILSKTIGDEYILICRACIPKVDASILPYCEFMEKGCRFVFEEHYGVTQESSQKRRKLDYINKEESVPMKKSCENHPQESTAQANMPAFDVVINENFIKYICPCERCTKAFQKIKSLGDAIENRGADDIALEKNLEGELNLGDSTGDTRPIDLENLKKGELTEAYIGKTLEEETFKRTKHLNLSFEAKTYISQNMVCFKTKMAEFFNQFNGTGKTITQEDVKNFFTEMDEMRKKVLEQHLN